MAARAFFDDPLFVHIHPDPATRVERFVTENVAYQRWIYRPLGQSETVEGLRGLALWLPPGKHGSAWRDLVCLPALARAVGLRRLVSVIQDYRAFDAALPSGAYWYLGLLAVAPEAQGEGVGGALLRHGLDRADRDGVGCYLETGTEENVAFYEHHGFRVAGPIRLPHGPDHWGMWRGPGGAA